MKIMKNYLLFLFTVLWIAGCSDDDNSGSIDPSPGNEDVFTEGINFNPDKESQKVSFTAGKDWKITVTETRSGTSWCKVEPMSGGPGEAVITIDAEENTTYDDRSVVLTIQSGDIEKTVKIIQKGVSAQITLETDEMEVETNGGEFRIKIIGYGPVSLKPFEGDGLTTSITPDLFIPFEYTNVGEIELKKEIKDGYLHIEVSPTVYAKVNPIDVHVYGKYSPDAATLTIRQKPDPDKQLEIGFTEDGKNMMAGILSQYSAALGYLRTMEAYYTHSYRPGDNSWKEYYDNTLTPSSRYLQQAFTACYAPMRNIYSFEKFIDEDDIKTRMAFENFKILLYNEMVNLWGDVIYAKEFEYAISGENVQMGEDNLVEMFINHLEQCVQVFDDTTKYPVINTPDAIFPSRDVPLALLGRFALHQKNWHKAADYLKRITDGGQYTLESSRTAALSANSSETLYALLGNENIFTQNIEKNDLFPLITYTEVVLGLADALSHLGNIQDAVYYLNMVSGIRGINTFATHDNHRTVLQSLWKAELKGTGTYFDFLKRNGLAESALGIESFRTLFPFPMQEIMTNPDQKQNPGYN